VPTENTPMRRALESWFRRQRIQPRVIGEFDDAALMKVMACEGAGFIAVPTIMANDAAARYGFQVIGATLGCQVEFYAITGERRLAHPGVVLIAERAAQRIFAKRASRKAAARERKSAPKQRRAKQGVVDRRT
jgi:LysR family transcriptional activator of nhaA